MADKREIRAIRNLLSKYKITLKDLQGILKGGKGVSNRNDEILKKYRTIRGPAGKIVRGIQDINQKSIGRAKSEGRGTGLLARTLYGESEKIKKQEAQQKAKKKKPTPLKDKSTITPKDVQTFKNFYNLNEPDFQRILQGNPKNDFENRVYNNAKKVFTPDKMQKLPETVNKTNPVVQSYIKARDITSGSEYTQEQQDINESLAKSLREKQDPTVSTVGEGSNQDEKEQSLLEKEVTGLLNKIPGSSSKINKAVAEHLPMFYDAFQQSGYEQRPQFGSYTRSPLLRSYDAFVNRIRPEENTVSQYARRFRPVTGLAGALGGKVGGAALGGLVGLPGIGGLLGGMAGGAGSNALTDYLTQEQPEFTRLANLLRGGDAGYFTRGRRGLADIIAGTQGKQEKVDKTLDVIGRFVTGGDPFNWFNTQKDPLTRFQRLRRGAAKPIRGLGNLLASPNAARNLRATLGIAEGLYGIGKATGLNDWLARKLGFVQQPQFTYTGFETGEQLANPIIASAVQRSLPFLQEQTGRLLGRNVTPEEVMGGLDIQLRDVLTPQVLQRNIQRANEDVARQQIQQQVNVEQANRQARQARELLQEQEQMQNFINAARINEQRAMEAELQADLGVRAGNLAAQQAVLGQKITPQPPLRRVVQQPTQLWDIAENAGRVIDPIAGQMIAKGLANE